MRSRSLAFSNTSINREREKKRITDVDDAFSIILEQPVKKLDQTWIISGFSSELHKDAF